MLFVYPAIFHNENDSYQVEFPDLPGCQTYGDTLNETIEYAQEALSSYLLTLIDENKPIPSPSDIKSLKSEDENTFTSLIPVIQGNTKI